jgi:hypothetical protein
MITPLIHGRGAGCGSRVVMPLDMGPAAVFDAKVGAGDVPSWSCLDTPMQTGRYMMAAWTVKSLGVDEDKALGAFTILTLSFVQLNLSL